MERLKARFIGQDGSLGYRTGQTYTLVVQQRPGAGPVIHSPRPCPYSTLASFMRNWHVERDH